MRTCGTGWLNWKDAAAELAGWRCVWVDLAGPHLGHFPADPVETTHVWAWKSDAWARIRVDEGEALIGYLHPHERCPTGAVGCAVTNVSPSMLADTWSEPHIRVAEMAQMQWEVVQALDGAAALYLRAAGE
ncbi:MAG: hypothetical protein ACOYEV_16670 [Candidatus Nanopelagicales bacterium]